MVAALKESARMRRNPSIQYEHTLLTSGNSQVCGKDI